MSEPPGEDRTPISWDALAAELAATREEAEARGDADPETWDAVATELAARVAERPDTDVAELPRVDEPAPLPPPVAAAPAPQPSPTPAPAAEPEQLEIALLEPDELRGGLEALL